MKKFSRIIALFLCCLMASAFLLGVAACTNTNNGGKQPVAGSTSLGNQTLTSAVENASTDVKIKLIRGKNVLAEADNKLDFGAVQAGDIIEISSDYQWLNINLFAALGEALVYAPGGNLSFSVPATATQAIYPSNAFGGASNSFTAAVASDADIAEARNLAVNPYDEMFVDEINNADAAALPEALLESAAVLNGEVAAYPHAYANRVTRNEVGFYARNAIDGLTQNSGHGNYPYQSWGYNQKADAEYVVYFGREVSVDEIGFVLRADYSGTKEHDTYWQSVTVVLSDGSETVAELQKGTDEQKISIGGKTTTYVRLKDIVAAENANSEMYAALTELAVYGSETAKANAAAEKTALVTTFGGKNQKAYSTSEYSAANIENTMNFVNDWFINITETTRYMQPDYNGVNSNGTVNPNMEVKVSSSDWKDSVYYSGLTEAFLTTGDLAKYYYMRSVGNQFNWKVANGNLTAHGDWYQIGESYLILSDLAKADYKSAHVIENANWNITRAANAMGYNMDSGRDWSYMGYWWCDALYMAMNTYTLLSRMTGNKQYVEKCYEGYMHWKGVLYNETYHLWHRDTSQFSVWTTLIDANGNRVPTFWARGNAWVLAALAKQLLYLDEAEFPEIYARYKSDFIEIAQALVQYQREDGTWNASIVDGNYYGGTETTGTCGFIYGYCVGMELGVLDGETYFPVVKKAYDGLRDKCMLRDANGNLTGQLGYMQTTGYQPQNYNSEAVSRGITHEFGMGLFLLASSALMRLCDDYVAPAIYIPADGQAY